MQLKKTHSDYLRERDRSFLSFKGKSWLRINMFWLPIGVGIGLILTLLISAFRGEFIGMRNAEFEVLYSVVVNICITNTIYLSLKLLKFNKNNVWLFITVYYLSGIFGMLVAIELIYLLAAWIFNVEYHFFHPHDAMFSSIIVVIVCTIIYIYRAQKESLNARMREKDHDLLKLKQINTQAHLAALQSKINPHFLYNSLNAIASLIHDDPDKAESMTLKLSKLFRYSINQNQEDLVEVQEEIDLVNTYLDIEKVRFGDRISFKINVDPDLQKAKIPRFFIQPLVENALKHGLKDRPDGGELIIDIRQEEENEMTISVSDNGSPFPDELETGYGLQSTYDKLTLLYDEQYSIQIMNSPVKQIKIQIPLNNG